MDTPLPTGGNQLFHQDPKLDGGHLEMLSGGLVHSHGISNHYLYAMIHDYDYTNFQALNIPEHNPTWIKPRIIKDLLPDYDFVVFMDANVIVPHLEVPFEWMFNRWGIVRVNQLLIVVGTSTDRRS